MTSLRCTRWTEEQLFASRDSWRSLLLRSRANPLFLSWDWVCCWWRQHRETPGAELRVYGITDVDGELVGIAPFYLQEARHLGLFSARRLQLIGVAWRDDAAVFSEYLDIISAEPARDEVVAALGAELLSDGSWDEIVLANVQRDSVAGLLTERLLPSVYARRAEALLAWGIAIPESFDRFLAQLASNTRRKLFHQRHKLLNAEYVVMSAAEWPGAFDRLDRFLAERWGGAKGGRIRAFHEEIIGSLQETSVRFTELRSGARCASVMLNIRVGGTEYYLQSGFDASFAHGLSPGYLHLGYAIESACRDGIQRFDLLAGRGLHRDYKGDLAASATPLSTIHLVRRGPLRALFQAADRLRGRTDITSRA
jgi:CelD/BcsL family acetyltransferase involved in cellulose biosynthesis